MEILKKICALESWFDVFRPGLFKFSDLLWFGERLVASLSPSDKVDAKEVRDELWAVKLLKWKQTEISIYIK